jgi:hypothetical protein
MRTLSILVIFSLAAGLGFLTYSTFLGPDRLLLDGLSLSELIADGGLQHYLIFAVVLLAIGFFEVLFLRNQPPADIKNGVTAEARVKKVWDTGTTINDDPQMGLLLQVTPPGGAPAFQAEARTVVPLHAVPFVKPGTSADVKYDPRKPARLQLLALHIQDAPALDAAGRLKELGALREKGLISEEEYRQKREEILETPN